MSMVETALVVDDDFLMRDFVIESLQRENIQVTEADDGRKAYDLMRQHAYDLAFIDLKMPGMNGMELLRHMQADGIRTIPIIMTAFGTVEKAVEAVRMGAYDFLMKPFSPEQVSLIVSRAQELVQLKTQNRYMRQELGMELPGGRAIVGKSDAVKMMLTQIEKVAKTDANVLVIGESGTGKELVGLAIHSLSRRREQPFVRMNCAAVPETLVDSELFGHERGAFTNAVERRIGRFELAHKGTLLLDEIGEMDIAVQAKLLRVLQEGEFERVGGSRTVQIDTRVIASTNRNLQMMVHEGSFRQDLYYRLKVVPLYVPSLKERLEDVPALTELFFRRFCKSRKHIPRFSDEALDCLMSWSWPGNIRELENLVEHICVMEEGDLIQVDALPPELRGEGQTASELFSMGEASGHPSPAYGTFNLQEIERQMIIHVLREQDGNRGKSADILGISVRTLRNKLNQYRTEEVLPVDIG
jgi:two-component system, NtrC family, response regulator AtoC